MDLTLPVVVGAVLAIGVAALGRAVGFDRERAYYAVILIVIGLFYELYAVIGGSVTVLLQESVGFSVFLAMAIVGFKRHPWLVAAGIAGHGLYDFIHGYLITNPGMPPWWPAFCGTYDVVAGAILAWQLRTDRRSV